MIRRVVDNRMSCSIRISALRKIVMLSVLATANLSAASDYDQRRAAALTECANISWSEHQTGLIMNPDGYRSYYVRSQCLQNSAVHFRDASLCSEVRRRWSIFSSWGISTSNCRKLVAEKINSDRATLEA